MNGSFLFRQTTETERKTLNIVTDAAAILARAAEMKAPVIVIDGQCGSGKTTLAAALSRHSGAPVVHMDDFFLPFDLRTEERLAKPGGNVDYERFAKEVLPFIGREEAFAYRKFHCGDGSFTPLLCPEGKLRIVEGSYSHHPHFMAHWQAMGAVMVFVSVPEEEQLRRLALRNPQLLERFKNQWIPMENRYFTAFRIRENAMMEWTNML